MNARDGRPDRRFAPARQLLVHALALATALATGCSGPTEPDRATAPAPRRIVIIDLAPSPATDESVAGVLAGIEAAGLRDGIDYVADRRSAQGDMTLLPAIVDAARSDGADLFVPVATQALQALLQRGGAVPTVFTFVANPVLAGAGSSNEDHLPWVTGVSTMSDFAGAATVVHECLPSAAKVGTLFCPAEVNSVLYRDELATALAATGISLVSVPVNTAGDVADAALALGSEDVDAVCQISDNLTSATFAAIVTAANRAGKPVFTFQSAQVDAGAAVAVARDFHEAGREAGGIAARVLRGESPAGIPFTPATATRLIVNLDAAARAGLRIPDHVVARANRVVGQR